MGINLTHAVSGLTLHSVLDFVAGFGAPVLGFLVALAADGFHPNYAWTALTKGAVAGAIVLGLARVPR